MSYREQLKQFFAKTFKGWYITVTNPKKFLLDCGFPDLPIVVKPSKLKAKIEKHNLKKEDLINMNTQLNSPLIVFHSADKGKYDSAFSVITEKSNGNGFLCVVIYINEKCNKAFINNIASIHFRNVNSLTKWVEDDLFVDYDKEKTEKVFSGSCHNDSKFEYLLSILDKAKINKNNENGKGNIREIAKKGFFGIENDLIPMSYISIAKRKMRQAAKKIRTA